MRPGEGEHPMTLVRLLWILACFAAVGARAEYPTAEELLQEREAIARAEKELEAHYRRVRGEYDAYRVIGELQEIERNLNLSPTEYGKLREAYSKRGVGLDPALAETLSPALDLMGRAGTAWKEFQSAYDNVEVRKHTYAIDEMMLVVESVHERVAGELPSGERRKLEEARAALREKYEAYHRKVGEKPLSRDRSRYFEYQDFMKGMDGFLETAAGGFRNPEERRAVSRAARRRTWASVRDLLVTVPSVIPGVARLLLKKPMFESVAHPVLSRRFEGRGYSLEVVGRENLPTSVSPGEIHVVPQPHTSSGELDVWGTVATRPRRGTFMWELGQGFFERLIGRHPEVLPVLKTRGQDPIQRIVEQNEAGITDKLLVFPEANLSPSVTGGTRPVQDVFSRFTLAKLRGKGMGITVTPITTPYHHRTRADADTANTGDPATLKVIVHPTVPATVVDLMFATGDPEVVGTFIRQVFIDSQADHPLSREAVAGSLPLSQAMDRLWRHVDNTTRCLGPLSRMGVSLP